MSALSYILDYGDDEDSSEDSNTEDSLKLKKPKLPTPNLSGVSVVSSEEHIDDPLLHSGRTRTFPHVRGNWATFICIDYPHKEGLSKVINKLEALVKSIDNSYSLCENVHISLSKTFVLRYHMIKAFTTSLQSELSSIESFDLNFDSIKVYCNEQETRTFLALEVDALSHGYLLSMIERIDKLLDDFRLPKFYENPSFHMSILSVNGNKKEAIEKILHCLNQIFLEQRDIILKSVNINKIHCKSGNRVYQYCLK